jgi:hypothetical protein
VRYSSLLLASVLVAPHLIVYDLLVLAPVFLLLSDWLLARRKDRASSMEVVLYLAYLAPLAGAITRWTHLQVAVVLMSVLVYMIWRVGRPGGPAFAT